MKELQQSVFLNLSRVSKYQERSRYLNQPKAHFAKFRQEEIINEFELVDFEGNGKLSRQRIKNYLSEKYQKVNFQVVDDVLATMRCDEQQNITKEEFCSKFIQREKTLYRDFNALASLRQRLSTLKDVYEQTKTYKPKLYAKIKITKLIIKSQREGKDYQEWMDIKIVYEDHKNKFNYLIQQPSYGVEEPSYQVFFPTQDNYFFVKFSFYSPKSKQNLYGQCYVNVPLAQNSSVKKNQKVTVDVANNSNQKIGYCQFSIDFESNLKNIQRQIEQMERDEPNAQDRSGALKKQYEYLQYLWGISQRSPHKIAKIDVTWIVVVRIVLASCIGLLSIAVQVLGRCQPLSFILSLVLAKNWKYVMLRSQKFLLSWLGIGAICLDLIWIAFGSGLLSQINYLNLAWCSILTYLLIVAKILLVIYMLIIQKAFSTQQGEEDEKL